MKKYFYLFLFIFFLFFTFNVYAVSFSTSGYSCVHFLNGTDYCSNLQQFSYNNIPYFGADFSYTPDNTDTISHTTIDFYNQSFCSSDNTGGLLNFRFYHNYAFETEPLDNVLLTVDGAVTTCNFSLSSDGRYSEVSCPISNSFTNKTLTFNFGFKELFFNFPFTAGFSNLKNEQCQLNSVDIINSQNQNTQDIINNQNQNNQNIINNQNQNTQEIIDNLHEDQLSCTIYDKDDIIKSDSFIASNGLVGEWIGYGVTDFISIVNSRIRVVNRFNTNLNYFHIAFYDSSKTFISSLSLSQVSDNQILTIPDNSYYVRFTIKISENKPTIEICRNGNQATTDALTDDTVNSDTGTSFFNDFTNEDFGLSQIITIPLNTIQSLTSQSCIPLQVPIPFTNSNVTLPCMTEIYENKFPSIYNLWKIVSFGIIAYLIAIDIFHIVKGFKDPESDKVEVLDL